LAQVKEETMPLLVRAFPLITPVEALSQFAQELTARGSETDAFYRKYGVTHESWHVQETPNGPWVIGVAKIENPSEAGVRYAASSEEFDGWFKSQVLRLTGIDLNSAPLGPPTTQVFAWADKSVDQSNLCE
jgi:hypothetical protein